MAGPVGGNQKAGSRPAVGHIISPDVSGPGGAVLHPGLKSLLGLLGFLCLLRLFRLLRFLSHSILIWVLMGGNATRGMLGGGPASQYPQIQSHQIRSALLHTAMPLSSRYPQLLRVFTGFSPVAMRRAPQNRLTPPDLRRSSGGVTVNEVRRPAPFLHRSGTGECRQFSSSSIQHHGVECCAAVRVR
jgi:hypothetical protein